MGITLLSLGSGESFPILVASFLKAMKFLVEHTSMTEQTKRLCVRFGARSGQGTAGRAVDCFLRGGTQTIALLPRHFLTEFHHRD